MKMYTVFDSKVLSYGRPFFMINAAEAIRGFSEVANDISTQIGKYPEDFVLFELGSFDETNGSITSHLVPVPLGCAIEFFKSSLRDIPDMVKVS